MTPTGETHPLGESRFLALADGRRLHHRVLGEGGATDPATTVLFESGMGHNAAAWGLVAPRIAQRARVVVYDRAGLGRSDPDPAPRTLARIAGDLGRLVDLFPGDLVLVGHSWGGPIVRTLSAARPGRVRALVLVDPSDETDDRFFTRGNRLRLRLASAAVPVMTLSGSLARRLGDGVPEPFASELGLHMRGRDGARRVLAELRPFLPELRRLRELRLDTAPTTLVRGATHNVHLDEPGLVVEAVESLL